MKRNLAFLAILSSLAFSYAQESVALDSVVTKGKTHGFHRQKIAENITLISEDEINHLPVQSVEEIIAYYTGVDLRRRGTDGMQADISIRGGNFEQVLLLINGVRMTNPQTAHNLWNIPFGKEAIKRIEIVKGPSAVKYGSNAFSGVINIITKKDAQKRLTINTEAGSYGTYKVEANAMTGSQKWQNMVNANYGASDGYRHNTDYTNKNLFYQGNLNFNQGNLTLQAGIVEKKFGANGFYASPSFTEQYEETQNSVVSIGVDKKLEKWAWNAVTYWKRGQDMYLLKRDDPSFYRNMHIGNNVGAEANASYNSILGVTGFGAEYRKEFLSSNNLGSRERHVTSLFVEHNFVLADGKINIAPGINWTNFSNSGDYFYPGIELGYSINQQQKLYANAAKVHRVPSFTELYYTSPRELGNESLEPETAISYEAGYRFQKRDVLAQISLFYRDTDDAIDWVKNNQDDPWLAQNISNTTTKGAEINVEKTFESPIKSIALGYTYIDKTFSESDQYEISRYVLDNLKHQLVAKVETEFIPKVNTLFTYRFEDRVTMDAYHLFDAKIQYNPNQNWSVFTAFNNILDTDYTESFGVPMPGFWFSGGVSYTIDY